MADDQAMMTMSPEEKSRLDNWLQRVPYDERPWNLPTDANAVDVDPVDTFDTRVRRLIEQVRIEHGLEMTVRPRRVHDEKCRYVLLESHYTGQWQRVCRIDKHTEAILPTDNGPVRGLLTDPNPSRFFGRWGLLYVADLQRIDPTYNAARRREYAAMLETATQNSKNMSSSDRKRLHAGVWDESGIRKKRVLNSRAPMTTEGTVVDDDDDDDDDDDE